MLFNSDYENKNLIDSLNVYEDRLSKGIEPNIKIQNNNKKEKNRNQTMALNHWYIKKHILTNFVKKKHYNAVVIHEYLMNNKRYSGT